MTDPKRAKVTDEHRQEAVALKSLWDDGRPRKTQTEFGEAYGMGNQANVGHYLLARNPLNVKAALAFAAELQCDVAEFSPRLKAEIDQLQALLAANRFTHVPGGLEGQLVRLFRELPPDSQDMVLAMVNGLHNIAKPEKSTANPFAGAPPPPTSLQPAPAPAVATAPAPAIKKTSKPKKTEGVK